MAGSIRVEMIRVASLVLRVVLFAPEVLAVRGAPGFEAMLTGGLDLWNYRPRTRPARANDEDWTRGEPHGRFGDRTQEEARHPATSVRADDNEVRFQVCGEL